MATRRTYVFIHLSGGPAPAGLLTVREDGRSTSASFAYGRRYLQRPDRVPVDPVTLPLHDAGVERVYRTEENAIAGAPAFNLTPAEARPIVELLRDTVRTRWEASFTDAGVSASDRRRFATAFRQADPEIAV